MENKMKAEYEEKKVGLSEVTYKKLSELSTIRNESGSVIRKNIDIVAQLISDAYKKESK